MRTGMFYLLKAVIGMTAFFVSLQPVHGEGSAAIATPDSATAAAVTVEDKGSVDQAVNEYLQLKGGGKTHAQALKVIREKYKVSDAQLEAAAVRLSSNGHVMPGRVDDHRNPATSGN
ncbi:MAG: hypothetical protein HC902_01410 [Calothrix sp. SM1_5_4]|nr:hypothetical protein [Calothrix sp. SM1_5_4]